MVINRFCREWLTATAGENKISRERCLVSSWRPPREGWVKINVDGGMCSELGLIYAGGLIRGSDCNWLGGFSCNRGLGSVLEAELWGVLEGLQLAWNSGFKNVVCECDSLATGNLLHQEAIPFNPFFNIICSCRELLFGSWECQLYHVLKAYPYTVRHLSAPHEMSSSSFQSKKRKALLRL
ncbi:hypothetical protein ACOSP7_022495 [Xanthoceras sorbifolium]